MPVQAEMSGEEHRKNIVITGFMGTGKSSTGRMLAERLGLGYLDTDELIEEETGLRIREIFERFGEARFREIERDIISKVTGGGFGDGMVLSTGGGAVVERANREALRRWGTLVCLTASVDAILERLGNGDERPLLDLDDRRERVEELLRERDGAYRESDIIVDTTGRGVEDVVRDIMDILSRARGDG